MKKFLMGLLVTTTLLCGSSIWGLETSHAASGWTLVDKKNTSGTTTYLDGVKGGNAKICLKDQTGGIRASIFDNDGSGSNPRILSDVFIGNGQCVTFNAVPYVDGSDNNAEFIVVTTRYPVGSYTLELWD